MHAAMISVELEQVVNLGNYESRRIKYGLTDHIKPDETPDQARARVYEIVKGWIVEDLTEHRKQVQRRS